MSFWKPDSDRDWLLDRGIAFAHGQSYEDAPSIGGVADSHVRWMVAAHLVGLGSSMLDLAAPCIYWIDHAIANDERCGVDQLAWSGLLTESKATAQWLTTGQNPTATWSKAFDERLATYRRHQGSSSRKQDYREYVDDTMACGYQAGRYVEAMAFHDELLGAKRVAAKNIKSPRQLAYALCLRAIGQSTDSDEDLILAGHRLLQQNLAERWLHLGNYQRAAVWLKIVHELASPGLSPEQVLLKAYDDMPTVAKPAFLNAA